MMTFHVFCLENYLGKITKETIPAPGDTLRLVACPSELYVVESVEQYEPKNFWIYTSRIFWNELDYLFIKEQPLRQGLTPAEFEGLARQRV